MDLLLKEVVSVRVLTPKMYEKFINITIEYYCQASPFGYYLVAFYQEELCFLSFYDSNLELCSKQLKLLYNNANFTYKKDFQPLTELRLLIKGTDFQVAVWKELLKIKKGTTVSYNNIADAIGKPKSGRAVGNAVGKNHIAYIIPCHRVIRKNGELGGFSCGTHRKIKMLGYEGVIF